MPVAARKALNKAAESGDPLPLPGFMGEVERRGGVFREGHLVMIAGCSNAGKSMFIQSIAAETNTDTLYFSADQDAWTTVTRLVSLLTGTSTYEVGINMGKDENADIFYQEALGKSNLQFVFDPGPSLPDLGEELDAYVDTWDQYPKMIVVDNLVNVEASGEYQDDNFILKELHGLARRTKACVVVLAHCKEGKDSSQPPAKRDILNQIHKLPELILTVALNGENAEFKVAIVKTREGRADPEAVSPVTLGSDFATCQFYAQPTRTWGGWEGAA